MIPSSRHQKVIALLGEWWQRIVRSRFRILAIDYDGTLAPFRVDRLKALPYAGVIDLLRGIDSGGGKVVIISGRQALEVKTLLECAMALRGFSQKSLPFTIFGCHGFELWEPQNGLIQFSLTKEQEDSLREAYKVLTERWGERHTERKHGSVALHWRGLTPSVQDRMREAGYSFLSRYAAPQVCEVRPFSGGWELKAVGRDKGWVIQMIYQQEAPDLIAYLGDDDTDEDAFREVKRRGGLGILVRKEYRVTEAQVWLQPPSQLRSFLSLWLWALTSREKLNRADRIALLS